VTLIVAVVVDNAVFLLSADFNGFCFLIAFLVVVNGHGFDKEWASVFLKILLTDSLDNLVGVVGRCWICGAFSFSMTTDARPDGVSILFEFFANRFDDVFDGIAVVEDRLDILFFDLGKSRDDIDEDDE